MPRGGPRPNSGGARPGAGRKSSETKVYQETMRARFEACVSVADWDQAIRALLEDAKGGSVAAFRELVPWVVGKVPDELRHTGAVGVAHRHDLSRLSDAEIQALEQLVTKVGDAPDA